MRTGLFLSAIGHGYKKHVSFLCITGPCPISRKDVTILTKPVITALHGRLAPET